MKSGAASSPDGEASGVPARGRRGDAETGAPQTTLEWRTEVRTCAISPDGERATTGRRGFWGARGTRCVGPMLRVLA
jgi:hypothetical protein